MRAASNILRVARFTGGAAPGRSSAPPHRTIENTMNRLTVSTTLCAALAALALAPTARAETHANLQAVTANGTSAWTPPSAAPFAPPVVLRGVILNNPEDMLDPTPNFLPWNGGANQFRMGGEWQIFFQATEPGDRGGTACWMGQNYGNRPDKRSEEFSYTNAAWVAEILRLEHDAQTGRRFRAGDLVDITARQSLFFGGKRNLNEGHSIEPQYDFQISLVTPNYGLPAPEVVSLADLVNLDDGNPATREDIFDATRATGGERWQGMRVRINGLQLANDPNLINTLGALYFGTNGWNPAAVWGGRRCTVTDGANRYFTLRHPRYSLGPVPATPFDAIGILNQESGSGAHGTNGYELFVQQIILPPPDLDLALNAVVSWPANGTEYVLETSTALTNAPWLPVTNSPVTINGRSTVLLPPTQAQQFFRLRSAP